MKQHHKSVHDELTEEMVTKIMTITFRFIDNMQSINSNSDKKKKRILGGSEY